MIELIRKNNSDAIILCGTPDYCKDLKSVIKNPINNVSNIMYTYHFYSGTHKSNERSNLKYALENNLPIFVSEFGISEATGDGEINKIEADKWISLLDEKNISYVYWNLSNKNEKSAFIKSQNKQLYNWKDEDLSEAGKWFVNIIKNKIYK